ncbi:MAG: hydroxyisourate hydrolase [Paracoccaceae bacterium]|nr:hydroxyisourate hydrolase [Paracoccaceae bacterium]MDE2675579.1 hydroxyisourate hydrolase [Paracoccaceae bacterium]MXZ50381.1 hydroxyisourate hydrolase [Paracoccaceae bacterium]MYF46363.1 hydroxyisourate hydrolase [Paracoccaceae bacterium]MYI91527.1 hydroxyisourate hydrolase [Paracoccaceae bacterium]
MKGFLTTHVLDTAKGQPAAGLRISLSRITTNGNSLIREMITNSDGRTGSPILTEEEFELGEYELVFHAGEYFKDQGIAGFYEEIPIRFKLMETSHYHVPLLLSPFGYSTYRGS